MRQGYQLAAVKQPDQKQSIGNTGHSAAANDDSASGKLRAFLPVACTLVLRKWGKCFSEVQRVPLLFLLLLCYAHSADLQR